MNVYERRTEADAITPEKWHEKTRGKREKIHKILLLVLRISLESPRLITDDLTN